MTKTKRILIAGYYGFGNIGDEAILEAILAGLRARREGLELSVVSADPEATAAEHGVRAVHWKDVDALLEAARQSDLVVLGGGGLFQDYWGVPEAAALTPSQWGISYYSGIAMLAILQQKPFMIYSVGVGPLVTDEGKRLTCWTFEAAHVSTVRDEESRDLLVSLGVDPRAIQVTPDPVLTLAPDAASAAAILRAHGIDPGAQPLLAICLRNWASEGSGGWKQALAAALDRFLEGHEARVVFIPFQVREHELEDDASVARDVASRMQQQERVTLLTEAYPPPQAAGLISHCRLVLGMRLHSLILAAGSAVPAVALAYDPKVEAFMRSLGIEDYTLDLSTLTADALAERLTAAWDEHESVQQTLRARTGALRERAERAPRLALDLLDGAAAPPYPPERVQALAIEQTRALSQKETRVQGLLDELRQRDERIQVLHDRVNARQHELNQILLSKTYRLALLFRRLRLALAPVGSGRERLARGLFRAVKGSFHTGSRASALVRQSVRRHGLAGATLRGFRILGIRLYHLNRKILHRQQYQRELKQLEALIAAHEGFFDIFHVPMGWNTVLFQRFQHVSLQTAKLGGLALYGGHPIVDRDMTVYRQVKDNLYVFDATNRQVVERLFQALRKKEGPRILRIQSIDLVTTAADVERFLADGFTVVYEYIDEITPAITGSVPDTVHERHAALLRDERVIVVATSDQLFETVRRHRSRNFVLSTNGVDLEHWRIPKGEPPADMKPALNGNLVIGYHGALARWIDYDLLRRIVDAGCYELVLIGHEHDPAFAESGLRDHPRVHFLGSKPYFELNAYAIHYDIAILPFKKSELTQAVSPVKVFEYMAAGKPVVTTDLRECRKYRSCLVAGSTEEFLANLERAAALRSDPEYLALLDREAQENSWERKILEILRLAGVQR